MEAAAQPTVTLYAIEESWAGGEPAALVEIECKETAKRYVAVDGRSVRSYGYRQSLDKGDARIHFTPDEAWAAFERAKSNHVTRLRAELEAAERDLAIAQAARGEVNGLKPPAPHQ